MRGNFILHLLAFTKMSCFLFVNRRVTLEAANNVVWKYDPISTYKQEGEDQSKWDACDCKDEEEAVRVTLL